MADKRLRHRVVGTSYSSAKEDRAEAAAVDVEAVTEALAGTYAEATTALGGGVSRVNEGPLSLLDARVGADNTGTTTTTAAVTNAINMLPDEGGEIFAPSGVYLDAGRTISNRTNISITGPGGRAATFKRPPGAGTSANVFSFEFCEGITVRGVAFDANGITSFGGGVVILESKRVWVDSCDFTDSNPIALTNQDRYAFVARHGVTQNEDVWFTNNRIETLQIEFDHCKRVHVLDNTLVGPRYTAGIVCIGVGGPAKLEEYEIAGNIIEDPTSGCRALYIGTEGTSYNGSVFRGFNVHDNEVRIKSAGLTPQRMIMVGNYGGNIGVGTVYRGIRIERNLLVADDAADVPASDGAIVFYLPPGDDAQFDDCHVNDNVIYRASNTVGVSARRMIRSSISRNDVQGIPNGITVISPSDTAVLANVLRGTGAGIGIQTTGTSGGKNSVLLNEIRGFTTPTSFVASAATDYIANLLDGALTTSGVVSTTLAGTTRWAAVAATGSRLELTWSGNTPRLIHTGDSAAIFEIGGPAASSGGTMLGRATTDKIAFLGKGPQTRRNGWAVPTGTKTRTAFDPSTATSAEIGERLAALIEDLHVGGSGYGLLGT